MRKTCVFLCLLALAAVLPASAQAEHNTIARVYDVVPKAGMDQQWQEGLKKFHQWEHEHHVAGTYYTWRVISGDRWGHYLIGTFGHDWKDFDAMEKDAPAGIGDEFRADLPPYTGSVKAAYYAFRTDLSSTKPNPSQPPSHFTALITIMLKPGGDEDIADVIKAGNAAAEKSHWSGNPSQWYSLVDGGEVPQLVLAVSHKDWADFQQPDPSFGKMLSGVYGKEGAEALGHKFNKQVRSIKTEILQYLPDLSYIPETK